MSPSTSTATRPVRVAKTTAPPTSASNGKPAAEPVAAATTGKTTPIWQYQPVSPGYRIVSANTALGFAVEIQQVEASGKLGPWHTVDAIPVTMLRPLLTQAGLLPNS